jgi:hypothetical protein
MGRRARRVGFGALLLLLAMAVGVGLFARSTRALQWAASQLSAAVEQAGGRLVFTDLSGSLFTAIGAARIDYEQVDGTRATLTGVQIDPSLAALWNRQLVFDRIAIATAGIERPASDERAVEPQSLALPIEVRVDREPLGVAEGVVDAGVLLDRGPDAGLDLGVGHELALRRPHRGALGLEIVFGDPQVAARIDGDALGVLYPVAVIIAQLAATGLADGAQQFGLP